MIPKIIHYCWFSGDKYPKLVKKCLKSWKKIIPDYEFRLWDSNSFDFNSIPFVKQAYENKKWAFVSDYIRFYALYHFGGIYLDSDVLIQSRFDDWHNYSFFTGIETRNKEYKNFWLEAAIIGSTAGNDIVREIMKFYENTNFINPDGSFNIIPAPDIFTDIFMRFYPWERKQGNSMFGDIRIFDNNSITNSNYPLNKEVKLYHCNNCSWIPTEEWRGSLYKYCRKHDLMLYYHFLEKIINKFKSNNK